MKLSEIDVEKYCVHSSRSAASSYAKSRGVSLKDMTEIEEFNIGHHILQP